MDRKLAQLAATRLIDGYGSSERAAAYVRDRLEHALAAGDRLSSAAWQDIAAAISSQAAATLVGAAERTILVVDDEPEVLTVLGRMLERAPNRVWSALSAAEALSMICVGHCPHLLLTDIRMPEMCGIDLARQATSRCPSLKVLFITGYHQGDAGAPDGHIDGRKVLKKPVLPDQLRQAVAEQFL